MSDNRGTCSGLYLKRPAGVFHVCTASVKQDVYSFNVTETKLFKLSRRCLVWTESNLQPGSLQVFITKVYFHVSGLDTVRNITVQLLNYNSYRFFSTTIWMQKTFILRCDELKTFVTSYFAAFLLKFIL